MLSQNSSAMKALPNSDAWAVDQLARDLKEVYVKIKRKQDPEYRVSTMHERKFLTKLAHKVFAIGGDAVSYMEHHAKCRVYFKNIYDVCSDPAVESYRQWIQEIAPLLQANEVITKQFIVVATMLEAKHTLRSILLNPSVDINPIVCFLPGNRRWPIGLERAIRS